MSTVTNRQSPVTATLVDRNERGTVTSRAQRDQSRAQTDEQTYRQCCNLAAWQPGPWITEAVCRKHKQR